MLTGYLTLDEIASSTEEKGLNPKPRSGRQEQLENLIGKMIW